MRLIWIACLVALFVVCEPVSATEDEVDIRAEIEGYRGAWNAGDADALASDRLFAATTGRC